MRLSLVRSPGYAMSDCNGRSALKPGRLTERMDQGERFYRFWFDFGREEIINDLDNFSLAHNELPMVLSMCPSGNGSLPLPSITLNGGAVLSAFKQAADGDGYILRLYEPCGLTCSSTLQIPLLGISATLTFTPFEIKTLYLDTTKRILIPAEITE